MNKILNNDQPIIEFVEEKSGVKLTYPNQYVSGNSDDEKYKELMKFGCSDVYDDCSTCAHRDCFIRNCNECNYYPIVEKYRKENNISDNVLSDFEKILYIIPDGNLKDIVENE